MSAQLINRTERLATIERMLFQAISGLRVVEIADACSVDRRTIYRDLDLLNEIGVPIYQKDGRYYLNHEYYVATVRLNINELIALYVASRGLAYYVEQQNPHIISALKKMGKALPEPIATHVQYMVDTVHDNPVDRAFVTVLETVTRAWAQQRKVKFWYRGPDNASLTVREFAIYFLEPAANGSLYAVGYDYLTKRVGAVQLERVKRVQTVSSVYDVPPHLDRRKYLASAWGAMRGRVQEPIIDIVLAFAPDVAPKIREKVQRAAYGVKITSSDDCILRMQVADWREILPWIRSWGTQVEVLEPRALREVIAAEARELATVYGESGAAAL